MTEPAFDPHEDPTTGIPVRRGGRALPPNSGNAAAQAAVKVAEEKREAQRRLDLQHLLPQEQFQRFAWDLIGRCGTFNAPRVFSAEAQVLHGRREVGLEVWHAIQDINPRVLLTMMERSLTEEQDS